MKSHICKKSYAYDILSTHLFTYEESLHPKTRHLAHVFEKSKLSFSSLRFGQFCDFRQRFVFPHLDPKGLKSCHFIRLVKSINFSPLCQRYSRLFC
ncbi:hypothetical protein Hanom_Chr03g00237681 [Helianthus anomalus]